MCMAYVFRSLRIDLPTGESWVPACAAELVVAQQRGTAIDEKMSPPAKVLGSCLRS